MSMIRVGSAVAAKAVGLGQVTTDRAKRASVQRRWQSGEPVYVADTKANRKAGKRITESEIADVVVSVLHSRPDGRATIAEIVEAIPSRVALSVADFVRSPSRPNEALWQQQVRNIRSHKAFTDYGFKAVKGGFVLKK